MQDFWYPIKMKEMERELKLPRVRILEMIITKKFDFITIEKGNHRAKYFVKKKQYDEIVKNINQNN